MADSVTMTMDDSAVTAAIRRLSEAARPHVKAACKVTATAIQREAKSRLDRMTHGTGQTSAGISVSNDYSGEGYIVHTLDVRVDRAPIPGSNKQRSRHYQTQHVGLYIEKGTMRGAAHSHTSAARPFFFSSALLELNAHGERIRQALQDTIDESGLGS